MNLQLLALSGAHIAILVVLLCIVAFQLTVVGYLIYQLVAGARKHGKKQRNTQNSDNDVTHTLQEGSDEVAVEEALDQASSETSEDELDDSAQDADVAENVSDDAEGVVDEGVDSASETETTEEADFTEEQTEAMLDEFDDEYKPSETPVEEDDAVEETSSDDADSDAEARAFADEIEQNAMYLDEQADEVSDKETDEVASAEEGESAESAEEGEETEYFESFAETVEEILEEHGLTSEDEITEEIAEEIMSVHVAHDESAVEVVSVTGLYKKYSKKADWAIADVNFHCYEGEIVGLLGHNGAGKSTTIKCLEGMLPFDQGEIAICGHDIVKEPIDAKANMGFVTDNHAVFVKMTGMQYLAFMADVYNVPTNVRKERIAKLEEVFQLGDAVNNLISSYSHGMRQKICMMGSLIHWPKLWVLDEPMTGLDPRTMHAVQQFMREYADQGNCIIFSSHALITVAKMCDRVVLLRTGCQLDELNIKRIMTVDPTFDFEEYFLKHEGQD